MTGIWYKNAIIYGVDVGRFADSDGDGLGDFRGLTERVPYLAELGATCIWLLPCYPSTDRDNGYDITDYYRIDGRFGTHEDFLDFLQGRRARHPGYDGSGAEPHVRWPPVVSGGAAGRDVALPRLLRLVAQSAAAQPR